MATATFPLNPKPVDPVVKHALETLVEINRYVDSKTFDLAGLSRVLGRHDTEELRSELEWLCAQGYIEPIDTKRCSLRLTQKGHSYEADPPEETSSVD